MLTGNFANTWSPISVGSCSLLPSIFFRAPNQLPLMSQIQFQTSITFSSIHLSLPLSKWHHLYRNKGEVIKSDSLGLLTPLTNDQQWPITNNPYTHSYFLPACVEEGCPPSCPKLTFDQSSRTQATHPTSLGIWCHMLSTFPFHIFNCSFSSGFHPTAHKCLNLSHRKTNKWTNETKILSQTLSLSCTILFAPFPS